MADNTETVAADASTVATDALGYVLVVRHAFADYARGEVISDAATISEILSGETACYVIKRAA